MSRFYLPAPAWETPQPTLDAEESKHAVQVLRLKAGHEIKVFDGQGRVAKARLSAVQRQACVLEILETTETPKPLFPLELVVAIPKGKTMDWIVQKAVELGVQKIQPLLTEHTVVRLGTGEAQKKQEKWQKVALEACKQCGQSWLPEVSIPLSFSEWMARPLAEQQARLIASLDERARPLKECLPLLHEAKSGIQYLIGPEGDFSTEETEALLASGAQPASLGEIVLRVETAVLYLTSVLRYESSQISD